MSDLTPVTDAYRKSRQQGEDDQVAFAAALTVYHMLRPDTREDEARVDVSRLIAEASESSDFWD